MIDAKKGKVDNDYFKNIIQRNEEYGIINDNGCLLPKRGKLSEITGWILDFFAYEKNENNDFKRFSANSLMVEEFDRLANQMFSVPFTIKELMTGKTYEMNYNVGFMGCDRNEKNEVFPVQAWIVSPSSLNKEEIKGFKDPFPPKIMHK